MKFIAISDIHLPAHDEIISHFDANNNLAAAINNIRNRQFDALLVLGDIAYKTPNEHSYQMFFNELQKIKQPVYCLPGNHDSWKLLQKNLNSAIENSESNFETTFNNTPFLFLDSSKGKMPIERIKTFLQKHPNQAVFLCAHHPALPTKAKYMEQRYALRNRKEIVQELENHAAPVTIISGHFHCFTESTQSNIRQIIVPSLLYQIPFNITRFAIDKRFGFCEISLSENSQCQVDVFWL